MDGIDVVTVEQGAGVVLNVFKFYTVFCEFISATFNLLVVVILIFLFFKYVYPLIKVFMTFGGSK